MRHLKNANRIQTCVFILRQSVWKARRSLVSVFWWTLWRSATTRPVKTASPREESSALRCLLTKTRNSTIMCARASARTLKSGWASTTCRRRAFGGTRPAQTFATRTGSSRSPTAAAQKTAPYSPALPVGSGWTRIVATRERPSVSSTSSEIIQRCGLLGLSCPFHCTILLALFAP